MSKLEELRRRYAVAAPEPEPTLDKALSSRRLEAGVDTQTYMGRACGGGHSISWEMDEITKWALSFDVRTIGGAGARKMFVADLTFKSGRHARKRLSDLTTATLREEWHAFSAPESQCIRALIERIILER